MIMQLEGNLSIREQSPPAKGDFFHSHPEHLRLGGGKKTQRPLKADIFSSQFYSVFVSRTEYHLIHKVPFVWITLGDFFFSPCNFNWLSGPLVLGMKGDLNQLGKAEVVGRYLPRGS
jgi:hypothetical protein